MGEVDAKMLSALTCANMDSFMPLKSCVLQTPNSSSPEVTVEHRPVMESRNEFVPITSEMMELDLNVHLRVSVDRDLTVASEESTNVLVSVITPETTERHPCDLVCVIDTSGSMSIEAKVQGTGGVTESHGLSILDIAKHGVRTIIKTLGEKDRLSLVKFHQVATTVLPLTCMDEAGQALAEQKLDELYAAGGTDIWQGLLHGLDALREKAETGYFGHIMLLTDGESQDRASIVPKLEEYKKTYERLPGSISTFGFGYCLDSKLLAEVAAIGASSYSYIPDAGFVGTAFVNTLSNLLVTMAQEVYVVLAPHSGAEFVGIENTIPGGHPFVKQDGCIRVNIGTLQYGQSKDIVVPMKIENTSSPFLAANVQYETRWVGVGFPISAKPVVATPAHAMVDLELVERHHCRIIFADALSHALVEGVAGRLQNAQAVLCEAMERVKGSPASETEHVKALLEDMCGQSMEAVSQQTFFTKWGVHYMPSLMFAHRLQQCNNFKDPGVQFYGGELFDEIRSVADDIFTNLPAPRPSVVQARRTTSASAPVSMAAYNNSYGG